MSRPRVAGVDSGGTFTDAVAADGSVRKVPSTPQDPSRAVGAGVAALGIDAPARLAHGTTVATNALLQRRLARVGLVTNRGFADVIEIARQARPSLYDPWADRPPVLVARHDRVEVDGRLDAHGEELVALGEPDPLPEGVEEVAVCLLHSDLDPTHERALGERLAGRGMRVTLSCDVAPEFREYERTVTTVVNAALRPVCGDYLARLSGLAPVVEVMTSAGGLVELAVAADLPAALLLSGPAAGAMAAARVAVACGFPDAVAFDMGGTSTDVCLIRDGRPAVAPQHEVAGLPIRLPSVDVHTIGAGGGSIALVDPGGALTVGPESAGAVPGPACYGLGGDRPTVTDANLVAGRIPPAAAFSGLGELDREAAAAALERAGVTAEGVLRVVDEAMVQAIRRVSVQRGVDPAGLALVAFGGAGPLHACDLADELGVPVVIVPAAAGVLSAVGLLTSERRREWVRTVAEPADHAAVGAAAAELEREVAAAMSDARQTVVFDCRYPGQSHELRIESPELHGAMAAFHPEHERRNGWSDPAAPVEVTAVRVVATVSAAVSVDDVLAGWVGRWPEPVVGPRVVHREDCTIWVPEGWVGEEGALGSLVLRRPAEEVGAAGGRAAGGRAGGDGAPRLDDPAELAVVISRLSGIAEEMGVVLQRGAFSPNIKERADCSAAVFDAHGRVIAQAEHIPVHLGSMPASVAAVIDAFGDTLGPGEQALVNDPFRGGTHLNDITLVAPCWVDDADGSPRLLGWVANRAHHADVGGSAPGSLPADATEIHQEGLRLPPVRLGDDVRTLLFANSRTPAERAGDLEAQVGANVLGVRRLAEFAGAAGHGAVPAVDPAAAFDAVIAHGERRVRAVLAELGPGTWSAEDQMDSTGSGPAQQAPSLLRCTVTVHDPADHAGGGITFDFTGTAAQSPGSTNAVEAVTESAVAFALRSALDPTLPANAGVMAAMTVVAPEGTIVSARFPAAVGAGNVEVSQRIADVCLRALAQAVPDRVGAASQGTMNNLLVGSSGPASGAGGPWVYYETVGGGQGGRPPRPTGSGAGSGSGAVASSAGVPGQSGIHTAMTNTDQVDYRSGEPCPGQSGIHTAMTNTRNTPIEALERAFPLRVLRYRLRWGSGGAGWSAGGEGIERDLQVLEDATVSLITERRVSRPWGLVGGGHGSVGENWLLPGGDESRAERLPDKCTIQLRAGDVVRMLTPGGGGWGAAAATRTGRQGSSPLRSA